MRAFRPERVVLGIDAAWTTKNPSGVAVAARKDGNWTLVTSAASFEEFIDQSAGGAIVDPASVIAAATRMTGRRPDLIAVDMPMMDTPISSRRAADNAVNRAYVGRGAGTHSPTDLRPGATGRALESALAAEGYPLATLDIQLPCRIEIYPHPALIELMDAPYRLPYKAGNIAKYWPGLPLSERRQRLLATWAEIVAALDGVLPNSFAHLEIPSAATRGKALKAFEDRLDAVIAAYSGAMAIEGRANPLGDAASAVWVPGADKK